jgi:hypothetical protein
MNRYRLAVAITLALTLLVTGVLAAIATAQDSIQIVEQSWESAFRQHITFSVKAESEREITDVKLFYQLVGQRATARNDAAFDAGKSVDATYSINQLATYFPPGTEMEYWWKLTDDAGNELKTEPERILYLDERYNWRMLTNDRLTLYWYDGRRDFGEALFDRANDALKRLETAAGVLIERPISIFIYSGNRDFRNAIQATAQEWTGGQAFTDEGVLVIGISPSNLNWGLQATAHEVTHLVIHQATENPYSDIPRWLDEGLAVYNENDGEITFDYVRTVNNAAARNGLFTIRSLSSTFPAAHQEAQLAYGQSGQIVKFIVDSYGPEKMDELLDVFSAGALADDALQQVLGLDTNELDDLWRESVGAPALDTVPPSVAAVVEGADSEAETEIAETTTQSEPVVEAEVNSEPVQAADPQVAETEPAAETAARPALPCLGGLLPILALGFIYGRRSWSSQ